MGEMKVLVHRIWSPEHVLIQDSGPGSMRRPPQQAGKDWTLENSREIPWVPLKKFMVRHAKSTDCYIRETFHAVHILTYFAPMMFNLFIAAKYIFFDQLFQRSRGSPARMLLEMCLSVPIKKTTLQKRTVVTKVT